MRCSRGRFFVVAAVLLWSGSATADASDDAAQDASEPRAKHEPLHRVAFELNPLGLLVGRYSASAEALLAPHHGVIVTPYYSRTVTDTVHEAGGAELGYRFFTGRTGPVGFTFGPSAFVQWGNDWQTFPAHGNRTEGVAFDVGGQTLLWDHILVGGGLGVGYTDGHLNKGGQVFPRALASVGFAL
jgi:hypothetical protein